VEGYDLNVTSGGGCGQWSTLLDDLEWLRGGWWQNYYVMVDYRAVTTGYSGCGRYPPDAVAGGLVGQPGRRAGQIAAQELGHNLGRHHAPGSGAGNPDGGYPIPDGRLDEYGVDISRMQLYLPGKSFDFMGYGGAEDTKWVSAYTYRALADLLVGGRAPGAGGLLMPRAQSAPEQAFLAGSGMISPGNVQITRGFYQMSLPAATVDGLPDGPYTVEVQDAQGRALSTRSFGPAEMSNDVPSESGLFHLLLPWTEGAQALVFKYNGTEIGRRAASAHAPTVAVTAPAGGARWGVSGAVTAAWQGADPDGDPLTYLVDYSVDDGRTWTTVSANVTGAALEFDASEFPGSGAARLRVTASDGFNTTTAVSDSFSVESKPPALYITTPDDGDTVPYGTPVVLLSFGTDPEDGPLSGADFQWSSSRDGALGTGRMLVASSLSVGEHIIRVTGTDASGATGSNSIRVIVGPALVTAASTVADEAASAGLPGWLGYAVIGFGVLIVALGVGAALRGRRAR
jgi:hypothetical protein